MGKNLIQQRRGRGTKTYTSPSFRFKGDAKHYSIAANGVVTDILHCAGHSAPLMEVAYVTGDKTNILAPQGIKVGDIVSTVPNQEVRPGNVLTLRDIPEGTEIHNLELHPGDGGKVVRSSGTFSKIVAKTENEIRVLLPSKKERI